MSISRTLFKYVHPYIVLLFTSAVSFSFFYQFTNVSNQSLENLLVTHYSGLLFGCFQLIIVFIFEGFRYWRLKKKNKGYTVSLIYVIVFLLPQYRGFFVRDAFNTKIILGTGIYLLVLAVVVIVVGLFRKSIVRWEDITNFKKDGLGN